MTIYYADSSALLKKYVNENGSVWTRHALAAPVFLAADDRLLKAAQAEGLAVDNPNLHP